MQSIARRGAKPTNTCMPRVHSAVGNKPQKEGIGKYSVDQLKYPIEAKHAPLGTWGSKRKWIGIESLGKMSHVER